MAGIYLHIPFCKQACHYCNFHFATSLRYKPALIEALLEEAALRKDYLEGDAVETIYFGGGTPSLCTTAEITSILATLRTEFNVLPGAEITLEANPDDITAVQLAHWKSVGINRLSIGVQSFFEEDLRWMNRAHTASQAIDSLQQAIIVFPNSSMDLIYGTPGLTDDNWKQNVTTAIQLGVPHLSCYALTVEPKTPLDKMIRLHRSADVDPDVQSRQFLLLQDWMKEAGYEHYEISNFAKPGFRSRHNSAYWSSGTTARSKNYLGLGPSAHSFNGSSRQWNIANNQAYIESINEDKLPFEREELTREQQLNEYIMTALRTIEGIRFSILENEFGITRASFNERARKFITGRLVIDEAEHLVLTREGKLLADGIAADLFY